MFSSVTPGHLPLLSDHLPAKYDKPHLAEPPEVMGRFSMIVTLAKTIVTALLMRIRRAV